MSASPSTPNNNTTSKIKSKREILNDRKWRNRFEELTAYIKKHGDSFVPLHFPKYPKLGCWVKNQRRFYRLHQKGKQSLITNDRIRLLDDAGFTWDASGVAVYEKQWLAMLARLNAHVISKQQQQQQALSDNNNAKYSTTTIDSSDLAELNRWVATQRNMYRMRNQGKYSTLTEERISLLNKVPGFTWAKQQSALSSGTTACTKDDAAAASNAYENKVSVCARKKRALEDNDGDENYDGVRSLFKSSTPSSSFASSRKATAGGRKKMRSEIVVNNGVVLLIRS
mmetsp:Transcript_33380/g.48313  ORF Transcript_33380/g.48313 Transcript_33380/m.48313 type:complete len:283 (-) Transcript_33380:833-1681(-)